MKRFSNGKITMPATYISFIRHISIQSILDHFLHISKHKFRVNLIHCF